MNKNSYIYRINRMKNLSLKWNLKLVHPLIARYEIPKDTNKIFRFNLKNYICRALDFDYEKNDTVFLKKLEKQKKNRKNVTPNGAVVPKREFNLEYNLVLKSWCSLIKNMTKKNVSLLRYFRMTPNIRIKYGKELKDNISRGLNTAHPHSDAWVEGPWGMNCYCPVFGDYKKNNLKFYNPIKFEDKFLDRAPSYLDMQWVMKFYKAMKFIPEPGNIYISDYALIHNTFRKTNSKSRISIDSTIFVDQKNNPPKSRIKEYQKQIPEIGKDKIVDSGQYENAKFAEKKSVYSHYTSKVLKILNI